MVSRSEKKAYVLVTTNSRALRARREQKLASKKNSLLSARNDRPEDLPRVLQPRQDQAAVC